LSGAFWYVNENRLEFLPDGALRLEQTVNTDMSSNAMAKTTNAAPPAKRAETADMSALGPLRLLPGENRTDYERLRSAVIAMMKPADFMEKIWTNDIIYLEWEILRFRRAKANFIKHLVTTNAAFNSLSGTSDPHTKLASLIAINIGKLEPLDGMIARMEQRRNASYLQAEQHRVNLGSRLRRAIEQVEDAEFRELKDEPSDENRAA
jgi:hypothetical protein